MQAKGLDISSRIGHRVDGQFMVEYKIDNGDSKFLGPFPTREEAKEAETNLESVILKDWMDSDDDSLN